MLAVAKNCPRPESAHLNMNILFLIRNVIFLDSILRFSAAYTSAELLDFWEADDLFIPAASLLQHPH